MMGLKNENEDLLLDYEDGGEFHLTAATVAFMKRDLQRVVGYYEVVVLSSYSIDDFRSPLSNDQNSLHITEVQKKDTGIGRER